MLENDCAYVDMQNTTKFAYSGSLVYKEVIGISWKTKLTWPHSIWDISYKCDNNGCVNSKNSSRSWNGIYWREWITSDHCTEVHWAQSWYERKIYWKFANFA